ncbi:transcription initiation factor TFIIB [Microdochium nivale]|nr:transcription initiation factor TFIIB [Microdochium nivale]
MTSSALGSDKMDLDVAEYTRQFETNLRVNDICPDCRIHPPNLIEEESAGDVVCTDCGRVLQNHIIDERPEWRTFSNDDSNTGDPSRVGRASDSLEGPELYTMVASGGGKLGQGLERAQANSIRDQETPSYREALAEVEECCNLLNLDNQHMSCIKDFFRRALKLGWIRRHNRKTGIAVCIAVICNGPFKKSRSLTEVCNGLCIDKVSFRRCFRTVHRGYLEAEDSGKVSESRRMKRQRARLADIETDTAADTTGSEQADSILEDEGNSLDGEGIVSNPMQHKLFLRSVSQDLPITSAIQEPDHSVLVRQPAPHFPPKDSSLGSEDLPTVTQTTLGVCERICDRLEFARSFEMSKAASSIIKNAMDTLGGKPPKTIAAACILVTCQLLEDMRTIKQISEAAGCGLPAIKKAYKMIWLERARLISADMLAENQGRTMELVRETPW